MSMDSSTEAKLESSDVETMEQVPLSDAESELSVFSSHDDTLVNSRICSSSNNNIAAKFRDVMAPVRQNLIMVKRVVHNLWLQYIRGEKSDNIRSYQVWQGNNVFFFHGRLVFGPDPRGLLLTIVSIILSSWIFAVYTGNDLPSHSRLIVTFSAILTVNVLVNLFLVSGIDPGIIHRNDEAPVEEVGTSDGTKRRKVTVNGVELKLKYCRICKIYRPPRSCHCAICDNCVERFDHHCPWIGQCIALRNYRFYLTFVISALLFFIYIFSFSLWRLHYKMKKDKIGFTGMLKKFPETVALISFTFPIMCFLCGLVVFHLYLIAKNQTGYENFRQRYANSKNPYDEGVASNFKEVLLAPLAQSRVNFRAEVMTNMY